ncbi:MAG: hypothetical protein ABIQ43_08350 [Sphingomonas sp.]
MLMTIVFAVSVPPTALAKDGNPVNPNKKTCRSQESTGSLFSKRICHTAAEWASIDERNRQDASNFDDDRRNKPNLPR